MKVKSSYSFTVKNIEIFDCTMMLIYKGYNLWQFRKIKITKSEAIRNVIYSNKIVANYLRGV